MLKFCYTLLLILYGVSGFQTILARKNNLRSTDSCPASCLLPLHSGKCSPNLNNSSSVELDRWYFDSNEKKCRPFDWGQCRGNANRFRNKKSCQEKCDECRNVNIESIIASDAPRCDCNYKPYGMGMMERRGGCVITVAPPRGYKCHCFTFTHPWDCAGQAVRCSDDEECPAHCFSFKCCQNGQSTNCRGYPESKKLARSNWNPITRLRLQSRFGESDWTQPDDKQENEDSNLIVLTAEESQIQKTLDLMEEGEKLARSYDTIPQLILTIGNPSSGKSTLNSFLGQDNSKLISVESPPGSGQFIIQPTPPTEEASTFPELIFDSMNQLVYYEVPSFNDTLRDTATKIALNYYSKLILEKANSVKIIVVAEAEAGNPNGNGGILNLPSLIDGVSEFLRVLPRYANSVALVVTGVNASISESKYFGEYIAKDGGAYVLKRKGQQGESDFTNNAAAFIQVTTSTDSDGKYNKIGILRKPNVPGQLVKIKQIQDDKNQILVMIQNQLNFSSVVAEEFNFLMSGSEPTTITQIFQTAKQKFYEGFKVIEKRFMDQINSELAIASDWEEIKKNLGARDQILLEGIPLLINATSPSNFITIYEKMISDLGFGISLSGMMEVKQYGRYLEFLSHSEIDFQNPMPDLQNLIEDGIKWCDLLLKVHDTLSSYKYQKDPKLYNVADLSNWGKGSSSSQGQGIILTSNNFAQICSLLEIKDNLPTDLATPWLQRLQSILWADLQGKDPEAMSEPVMNSLTFKGPYIKLSEVHPYIIRANATGILKHVKIYASVAVFIDDSLNFTGGSLSILAPKWEVIASGQGSSQSQVINLNGVDSLAELPKPKQAIAGHNGTDGQPGTPGGTAGNFLGVGGKFINLKYLSVSANGGLGGPGQSGGKGGDGVNGTLPDWPSANITAKGFYPTGTEGVDWFVSQHKVEHAAEQIFFTVYGSKGEEGKTGGDGGVGGKGGLGGRIQIINLDTDGPTEPIPALGSETNTTGKSGDPGLGGVGGIGGFDGRNQFITWVVEHHTFHPEKEFWRNDGISPPRTKSMQYMWGRPGSEGINTANMTNPQPPIPPEKWSNPINEFKQYLRTNLKDQPWSRATTLEFLQKIETDTTLNTIFDTQGLLDDYTKLEEQYYQLYKTVDMNSFYESILKRVNQIATSRGKEIGKPERKALSYIYTSALTKITAMNSGEEKNLIIDMERYIEKTALKNIERMKSVNKEVMINDQLSDYLASVNKDIEEAGDFIKNDLSVSISKTLDELDSTIGTLITESKTLAGKAENKTVELKESLKKLKHQLLLKTIFGIVKTVAEVAKFCGPFGIAAGAVTGTVTSIIEPLVLDPTKPPYTILPNIPKGVKDSVDAINKYIKLKAKEKIDSMKAQIDEMKKIEITYPNKSTKETQAKIQELSATITKEINAFNSNNTAFSFDDILRMDNIQGSMSTLVDQKTKELNDQIAMGDKIALTVGQIYANASVIWKAGSLIYDEFNKIKADYAALNVTKEAISGAYGDIVKMQKYERRIYESLAPMLNGVISNIHDLKKSLGSKTQIGLDVAKWRIQPTLTSLMSQINGAVAGFSVAGTFKTALDTLTESMLRIIHIYDRIQTYKDKKDLATFIANVGSQGAIDIDLDGTIYKAGVDKLEQIIRCNLILSEYERVVSGFKQWVFPFADAAKNIFYLPGPLQSQSVTVDEMILNANRGIEGIQIQLENYRTTIRQFDSFVDFGDFSTTGIPNPPFFTWSNSEFGPEINELLSGRPITIPANIWKARTAKEAIKFNKINIALRSIDQTRQPELDKMLENFNLVLTHSGHSYYMYEGQVYVVHTPSQEIRRSFHERPDGTPSDANSIYNKILSGDILLSPFCYWTIQIVPNARRRSLNFDLKGFGKTGVDVLLVGTGKYVYQKDIKGKKIPPLHLENYYESVQLM